MKHVVLSLFAGLCLAAPAALAIQPEEVCGLVKCSEPMKAITETFRASTGPVKPEVGTAYSGVCYYISGSTPPDYPHAGLAVLTPAADEIEYRGVFSFYGKPADYADFTYERAFKQVDSQRTPSTLKHGPRYSGYLKTTENTAFSYWFGSSPDGKSMKLVSIWLFDGQIGQVAFCDMTKHAH